MGEHSAASFQLVRLSSPCLPSWAHLCLVPQVPPLSYNLQLAPGSGLSILYSHCGGITSCFSGAELLNWSPSESILCGSFYAT